MVRTLARLLLILAAVSFVAPELPRAAAAPISPNNPFRSYNLSGVNYGSQQWEKQHRSKSSSSSSRRTGKLFGRRR